MSSTHSWRSAVLYSLRRHLRRQALPGAASQSPLRRSLRSVRLARSQHAGSASAAVPAASVICACASARSDHRPAAGDGGHRRPSRNRYEWSRSDPTPDSVSAVGIPLVDLYSPSSLHSKGSPFTMAKQEERQTLISGHILADNSRLGDLRKPARLRRFPAVGPGLHWPGSWPGQPGAKFAQPAAILAQPAAEIGPFPPLGIPLNICEVSSLIGCSPWTVRQTLIPRGLPVFRSGASGKLIFYRDQVVRWIQQIQGGN
jgi:hypothetical protein